MATILPSLAILFGATINDNLLSGVLWALPLIGGYFVLSKMMDKADYNKVLEEYKNRTSNFYEYSQTEDDDEVYARAKRHRELLKESGNQLRVQVYELYFKDGNHANETWEEFEERVNTFQKADNLKRNVKLSKDKDWYKKFIHKQKEVEYEV